MVCEQDVQAEDIDDGVAAESCDLLEGSPTSANDSVEPQTADNMGGAAAAR